jgi:glycosyltransferase involved in cell wall biosynthesis
MSSKLSVVIPFYNRKAFLRRAIESILRDEVASEIIAVDDGSTDGGAETLNGLAITLVRNETNRGPAHARNVGFSRCSGDLIYFFDSDDELFPGALRVLADLMEKNPAWNAVGGRIGSVIDEEGQEIDTEGCRRQSSAPRPTVLTYDYFLHGPGISGGLPQFVFRKLFLESLGPIDESLRCAEDRELLLRALSRGSIPLFDIPLFKRRVHGANLAVRLDENNSIELKPFARAWNLLVDRSAQKTHP